MPGFASLPSDFDIAKTCALLTYNSWSVVNRDSAARNAWILFCGLLRLDDMEIDNTGHKTTLRARTKGGIGLEASGEDVPQAFERMMGKV